MAVASTEFSGFCCRELDGKFVVCVVAIRRDVVIFSCLGMNSVADWLYVVIGSMVTDCISMFGCLLLSTMTVIGRPLVPCIVMLVASGDR